MVFYNKVNTSYSNIVLNAATSLVTWGHTNPYEQMIHESYWWNNRRNKTGTILNSVMDGLESGAGYPAELSDAPKLGREVFTNTSSPGITAGTLANRPVSGTTNQGYWATDQSTTDLTGMIGPNPSNPISGTLYRWDGSQWVSFYTPYTYPHPLRSDPAVGD